MVSLWPWKAEDNSPASFEKALSAISAKISKSNVQLDALRQQARRFRALWTLYSLLAYILVTVVLVFVAGWESWNVKEYGAVVGGPAVIYAVRKGIVSFYAWRISGAEQRLEVQEKERDGTIKRLKDATKYDTTLQLLEKYGEVKKPKPEKEVEAKEKPQQPKQNGPTRTGFAPPPTANIRSRGRQSMPTTFQPVQSMLDQQQQLSHSKQLAPTEEFAPNAFSAVDVPSTAQPPAQSSQQPQWYDRILDVILGEDETQAKNRLALLCSNCRLVNGLAPPGVKTPQQLGKWQCSRCKSWNGEDGPELVNKAVAEHVSELLERSQTGESSEKEEAATVDEKRESDAEDAEEEQKDDAVVVVNDEDSPSVSKPKTRRKGKK